MWRDQPIFVVALVVVYVALHLILSDITPRFKDRRVELIIDCVVTGIAVCIMAGILRWTIRQWRRHI
jgi:hypothetical protein